MSHCDCPPLSEAIEAFRTFLSREGHSPDLMWVFREDVVEIWPTVYLRVPHADRLSALAGIYQ